jgi:hypothetical protein
MRRADRLTAASVASVTAASRKRRNEMKKRILTVAVALASVLGVQQAFAKSPTTTASSSKKHHHKKHKKTAAVSPATPTDDSAMS